MKLQGVDTINNSTANKGIAGNIKELGNHVFVAGTKQQHHFTKTQEEIADHTGALYGMDMCGNW